MRIVTRYGSCDIYCGLSNISRPIVGLYVQWSITASCQVHLIGIDRLFITDRVVVVDDCEFDQSGYVLVCTCRISQLDFKETRYRTLLADIIHRGKD